MSHTRLMVDIQTMSTHNHNALILSVGALTFDLDWEVNLPVYGNERSWVLDIPEQLLLGRHVDPRTQKWWSEQSEAAKVPWRDEQEPVPLEQFTQEFGLLVEPMEELWANGIVFDVGNLASLWAYDPPWRYNAVRDARTIYRLGDPQRIATEPDVHAHDPVGNCYTQVYKLWQHWPRP